MSNLYKGSYQAASEEKIEMWKVNKQQAMAKAHMAFWPGKLKLFVTINLNLLLNLVKIVCICDNFALFVSISELSPINTNS